MPQGPVHRAYRPTGNFNYVNHAVAANLHINGPITDVDVIALNDDGTPKTARLSGTCDGFLPACTFSVVTEDNGEPAVNDRFGIAIVSNDQVVEARSLRVVRNGSIQFHSAVGAHGEARITESSP